MPEEVRGQADAVGDHSQTCEHVQALRKVGAGALPARYEPHLDSPGTYENEVCMRAHVCICLSVCTVFLEEDI